MSRNKQLDRLREGLIIRGETFTVKEWRVEVSVCY